MNKYFFLLIFLILLFTAGAGAEPGPAALSLLPAFYGHLDGLSFYDHSNLQLDFLAPGFRLLADMSLINDSKYTPSETYMLGRYFYLNENSVSFFNDRLFFSAGRLAARSLLDTPYSLYLSSAEIPSVGMNFMYTGEHFFYNNRWVRLNERSDQQYPGDGGYWLDRGMNHKTFGLSFNDFRFGFQDSVVYLDRSFDWEYFLSPMPQYFVQLVTTSQGKPWTEQNNDNSLMGFFCEYDAAPLYLEGQLLVDDINASFLPWIDVNNLTKMAWSLGGHYQADWGRVGFYHSGATKYTFAATYASDSYSDLPYEYTYYPATEYSLVDDTLVPLLPEDNYIGYLYGENNLAFMATCSSTFLKNRLAEFHLDAALEWVLNGSKSPANPWHEYDSWLDIQPSIELLSDEAVEHIVRLQCCLEKPLYDFTFSLQLTLGGVFNGLVLEEAVPEEPKIFRPGPGNHSLLFNMRLGVTYRWQVF